MQTLLPQYIFHLIFINMQMFFAERARKLDPGAAVGTEDAEKYRAANNLANTFNILSFLFNIINIFVFTKQTQTLGSQAIYRIWSITDFCIIVCNITVFTKVFFNVSLSFIRIVEAILIILIWFKSLYYMRLVGAIAPLVDSIFVIMREMLYFLFIFIIGIIALSQAFYIIGNN